MPNKTVTQVPVTSAEIRRVNIDPGPNGWVVAVTYLPKDSNGNAIGHHKVISWVPGTAAQNMIQNFVDSQCTGRANQQEGT